MLSALPLTVKSLGHELSRFSSVANSVFSVDLVSCDENKLYVPCSFSFLSLLVYDLLGQL